MVLDLRMTTERTWQSLKVAAVGNFVGLNKLARSERPMLTVNRRHFSVEIFREFLLSVESVELVAKNLA